MIKRLSSRLALLALAAVGLAACSFTREAGDGFIASLPPSASGPQAVVTQGAPSVKVLLPEVPTRLDTRRIALQRKDGATDYYDGMRWPDFLPLTLQAALVRDLAASGRFNTVVADTSPLTAPNVLQTRVIDFSVQHQQDRRVAVVKLRYQVLHAYQAGAFNIVEGQMDLADETPAGIRNALGGAYQQAVQQVIDGFMTQLPAKAVARAPAKGASHARLGRPAVPAR